MRTSLETLFARGNYAEAAMRGAADDWRTHAAWGLMGKFAQALEELRRFEGDDVRFHEGAIHWIAGDEERAVHLLEKLEQAHARKLLEFIRAPRLRVLAQLSSRRSGPEDLLSGIKSDARFEVRNISFHPDDLPNRPHADVRSFYDAAEPPHFYLCHMVEFHLIPMNLSELPCPLIGQTSDYQIYLQSIHPWLQQFDEVIVSGASEWNDLTRLVRAPVTTFPKCYGLVENLAPLPRRTRTLDLVSTGTVLHPFRWEKAELFHQIERAGLRTFHVNGFIDEYQELLAQSRTYYSWVPSTIGISTKAIEGVSQGCCVLLQRGSIVGAFVEDPHAVPPYEVAADDVESQLRRVLSDYDRWKRGAERAARGMRRDFALPRVASEYFRFAAFLAARPRGPRTAAPIPGIGQKRSILAKGWRPPPHVIPALLNENVRQGYQGLDDDPRACLDLTRELLLWHADTVLAGLAADPALLLQTLRWGVERYPSCLPLAFNAMRAHLHFGSPTEVAAGVVLGRAMLQRPAESWQARPLDDVLPWDVLNTYFNYRRYLDLAQDALKGATDTAAGMRDTILASVHYYLSHFDSDPTHPERAVALDPEFPHYKLRRARVLVASGGDAGTCFAMLRTLIEHSILFVEAAAALSELVAYRTELKAAAAPLLAHARRAKANTVFLEPLVFRRLGAPGRPEPLPATLPPLDALLAMLPAGTITPPGPPGVASRLKRLTLKLAVAVLGVRRGIRLYGWFKSRNYGTGLS